MLSTRPTNLPMCCALALTIAASACGERPGGKTPDVTPADVVAGAAQTFDRFVSPEGKFAVDFPPVWAGHYTGTPHATAELGSHFVLDFRFKPDPAWKVEPKTLLVIHIFTPAAWAKAAARPGPAIGVKIQQRDNDVYVLSLANSNPYKTGSAAAALFDKMMLAVLSDPVPLRLTPR
ncbi:MAG TPA: hypothetical protein VN613_07615 [Gemmatimonadaceae bacterium]|nr:hypothetical protein [Gemmatimonadaceae bacterium]